MSGCHLKEFGLESYWSLAFSPDGKMVVAVGPATPVKFWDTTSGREIVSFQRPSRFVGILRGWEDSRHPETPGRFGRK